MLSLAGYCCPAALGDWELFTAFVLPWVSSPHWGLGSSLGKVYFGKTNKSQTARPASVWCLFQPHPCHLGHVVVRA